MAKNPNSKLAQQTLQAFNEALNSGNFVEVRQMLRGMSAAEIAFLIESSPPRSRNILWKLVDRDTEGEILQYLNEEIAAEFLRHRDTKDIISAVEEFDVDDAADLLQELPRSVTNKILDAMDDQNRQRIEAVLSYDEDTAGGLMNPESITVRPDITLEVVMRYMRRHDELPDMTDSIMVVNRADEFVGVIPLTKLLVSDPGMSVRDAMRTDVTAIPSDTPASEVAKIFERQDLITAPVIDNDGRLIGRVTIDDVVDVIREEGDHSLMSMAGLDEDEDTFAPVLKTTRRRSVWLGINLLTALLASWVIGLFEATLDKVVALAVLMPIVASMGGIAGSQTLTLVIRGMALGHVGPSNTRWLLSRELAVGAINGILWSLVIGLIASVWFNDYHLGGIIASAMIINLVIAAIAGASLPLVLDKLGIDPALSGGVVLTTVTDVVGFFAFLGLATAFYM
ncbi:MAG: magnesium transporter [Pseudomonadales bacterium]|nr:magnesium transporter [Pseudomonadales bacterium]